VQQKRSEITVLTARIHAVNDVVLRLLNL